MGRLTVIPGAGPLVLVAPHGGRRDPAHRPWASGHLRVNDLHTAELTAELAASIDAPAVINAEHDRNEVDLNRICEAHDRAPWFLEELAAVVDGVVARHGRATLLALHGWNVAQPVVDLGLGCAPGENPYAVGRAAAVAPEFAAAALPRLVGACLARGIGATVGARYPARNRENLVQLFTPRYRDDARPLVRALAAHAAHVDAVQLELGIALRWPGRWRTRLLDAIREALPSLAADERGSGPPPATPFETPAPLRPVRLEFTAPSLCGLVGVDGGRGGRLLLFPPGGGLALFTGERIGLEPAGTGAMLRVDAAGSARMVRFCGPLLRFPDTTPFLDLESGLARAELIEAEVELDFVPEHPACGASGFGGVTGTVLLDGVRHVLTGDGFAEDGGGGGAGPWPRLRVALRLADGARLALTAALDGSEANGFLCRDGRHLPVTAARATLADAPAPFARVVLEIQLADGERLHVAAEAVHRLPVVRARGAAPILIEFAACRVDAGRSWPAGWLEAAGI